MPTIVWTRTDEAPLLATYSLKPIVEAFASTAGVDVETRDISLAGRIIAQFPERLSEGPAPERRACGAWRACHHPGSKHHQAAQHLGFPAAAQGSHQGTPGRRF